MNDTDRTEGVDTTPDDATQDAAAPTVGDAGQAPALEAGPSATSPAPESIPQPEPGGYVPPAEGTIPPGGTVPPAGTAPTGQVPPYAGPTRMLESEARNWSMGIHMIAAVAVLLSAGTISWLVPLVVWLVFRERSALIDHHGKQNLNLQLTILVSGVAAVVLGLMLFVVGLAVTLPLWGVYVLYAIVISFVAGVKASNGEYYRIPLIIPFLR